MSTTDPSPRCDWSLGHPAMIAYHDTEWGVPVHEDQRHYEFLVLDAAQAGLSWRTILLKRDNYRRAFHQFNPERVARYTARDVQRLLGNAGIVRNRLKIESAITNARKFLAVQEECGSFDRFIWQFVDGQPRGNRFHSMRQVPAHTAQSDAMSQELRRRGFRFVGSTICYAYMQAAGLVNDHLVGCFRYREVQRG